ncbi:MAG: hypothetical protein KBS53_00385, partial [Bacteroidales bacterium]|nr:hypothetical protein [Candidatus Hennigimonas equi]
GICAFQSHFCSIGVECREDGKYIVGTDFERGEVYCEKLDSDNVFLKLSYDFSDDTARMSYSRDSQAWIQPDYVLQMRYTLDFFTGYRTALYCYNVEAGEGGFADFDWFRQNLAD